MTLVVSSSAVAARCRPLWWRARRSLARGERPIERTSFYAALWAETAAAIGAEHVVLPGGFVELRREGRALRVKGGLLPLDDPVTLELAGDKAAAATLLRAAAIPMPDHETLDPHDLDPATRLLEKHGTVVVKPQAATGGGAGVTTNVRDGDDLRRAVREAACYGQEVLVEEQVDGDVFRLLYLDGQLLDAVLRRPARVRGDGGRSVRALVEIENARRRAAGAQATGFLPTGTDQRTTLRAQGLDRRHVPAPGVTVQVSGRSNTGDVADSRSVLDEVGCDVRRTGALAAEALGVRLAGVDVITTDIGAPLAAAGGVVNEVNTTPGLHWHYLVADAAPRVPVGQLIAARLLAPR